MRREKEKKRNGLMKQLGSMQDVASKSTEYKNKGKQMQERAEMKLIFQNIEEHVVNNFEIKENNIERNSKY